MILLIGHDFFFKVVANSSTQVWTFIARLYRCSLAASMTHQGRRILILALFAGYHAYKRRG
jgi:hypothetical protein